MDVSKEHGDAEHDGKNDIRIAPEFFVPKDERHEERQAGMSGKEKSRFESEAGVDAVKESDVGIDLSGIDADVRHGDEHRTRGDEDRHCFQRE